MASVLKKFYRRKGEDTARSSNYLTGLQKLPSKVIRELHLSYSSIEEIERLKRDENIYRSTQRNQLGISKPNKGRSNKLNWIDLFNIGNVMLMRGQDIQVPSTGWSYVGEVSSPEEILKISLDRAVAKERGDLASPDLSIEKCGDYSIAKDSLTEIVLLTIISYFCVSTEQRFINMN
mmetsp:Transcript_34721/g.53289  ORF Transcript_34721/g.53289 Transcript_34721/m.53289 type:complete len:177 (+) Transcript_34721:3063-3593(+)